MALDPDRILQRSEIGRISELNHVARFHQNFGFEKNAFEYLLRQKDLWADKLFHLPEKQLQKWIEMGQHPTKSIDIIPIDQCFPDFELKLMSPTSFHTEFSSLTPAIDLTITKAGSSSGHKLNTHEKIPLKSEVGREGIALHVGGRITALKWCHSSETSYLAVFVISSPCPLTELVSNTELSIFPGKTSFAHLIRSAIQLWEYVPDSSSLKLVRVINTTKFGATSDLRWLPVKPTPENVGVLSAVFTDGSLHFFKIKRNSMVPIFEEALSPSYTISCKEEKLDASLEYVPITSFDFLSHDRVIVGTFDGCIAEYIIPNTGPDDGMSHIPSFLQRVSESAIKTITVGRVGFAHLLLCHSMGNQSYAFHYENMRLGRVESDYTSSIVRPLYHENLRLFIYPDSAESLSLSFARHPQLKATLIMKTELLSSFHTSEYLNHPFAIIGNILGQVFVVNFSRRIFALPKSQLKFVNPLKLWTLYKNPDSCGVTLSGDYESVPSDRSSVMYTFTPPEVVISATAWNENVTGSSCYAFGTYTGLLVIERLDTN